MAKKKSSLKKMHPIIHESASDKKLSRDDLDRLILENFITLQKVLTNLTVKFDKLSDEMGQMLNLFEISAKTFTEKNGSGITKEEKEFLDKLDRVLDQNKVIAKGLTLMEERIREKGSPNENMVKGDIKPRPLPRF